MFTNQELADYLRYIKCAQTYEAANRLGKLEALETENYKLWEALKRRCACRFEHGKIYEECHYHQCERSVRLSNGDPSDVTLLDENAKLREMLDALLVKLFPVGGMGQVRGPDGLWYDDQMYQMRDCEGLVDAASKLLTREVSDE